MPGPSRTANVTGTCGAAIRTGLSLVLFLLAPLSLPAQSPTLQLHFMHVGQGDGAVLISPGGQVVLFDSGVRNNCDLPLAYLQQLGVDSVDYHIASHYHDDHIGCADTVLAAFPVRRAAVDRGQTYTTATYRRYEERVRPVRVTATPGMTITLDSGSTHPVLLTVQVVNGITARGDTIPTNNENDRSVVVWVRFGLFDALIGGDLSGARTSSYRDIETPAAGAMGQVEVYKVHHHSTHSSNDAFLAALAAAWREGVTRDRGPQPRAIGIVVAEVSNEPKARLSVTARVNTRQLVAF